MEPLRVEYKRVDDCIIYTDIYVPTPAQRKQPSCPVVLAFHGGAFMLGHSRMNSSDQISDCLSRGWIVVAPEHRLCPQVDIHEGPISDARHVLEWVYDGGLEAAIKDDGEVRVDYERVMAFGTSSGGTLALALGYGVKRRVIAILDFYGATNFADSFWTQPLPHVKPPPCAPELMNSVYSESPIPIQGGVSLEGQAPDRKPPGANPRTAFALTQIAQGKVMDVCFPSKEWEKIDATCNVSQAFPPTVIVHGTADTMVPMYLSKVLFDKLQAAGVESRMIEVPDEEHTFVGKMVKGSKTWNLQREGFDFLERVVERNN